MSTWSVSGGVEATSSEDLRQAAQQLRAIAAAVTTSADSLGQISAGTGSRWTGLAALEQASRAQAAQRLVAQVAEPGREAASSLDHVAATAEDCATRLSAWRRRESEAVLELHRLQTLTVPVDPAQHELLRLRADDLQRTVTRCRGAIEDTELEFVAVQRNAAQRVRELWDQVERGLADAVVLGQAAQRGLSARAKLKLLGVAAPGLWAMAQARRAGEAAGQARAALQARARLRLLGARAARLGAAVERIGKVLPTWARPPGVMAGPVLAVGQWWGAWGDLRDGGGYPGWRGSTTKTLAGAAVVGIPASFAVPFPPVALAGITATATYQVWMAGNWLYDHRRRIGGAVGRLRAMDAAVATWTERRVAQGYRGARSLAGRARDRLRAGARDLARLGSGAEDLTQGLRDRMRQLGQPRRWPQPPTQPLPLPVTPGSPWGTPGLSWGIGTTPWPGARP